jgi:predicted DNA-binding transcriptional regulator AlpA
MKVINDTTTPEVATGNSLAASPFADKRAYAKRWQGSTRWVDDLIARGMPHLKIGSRRVRICVVEADEWMQSQFRTQRRAVKGAQ